MMDELAGVLGRPRFEPRLRQLGLTPPAVLASVLRLVTLVPDPPARAGPPIVPEDPDDEVFLLCAAAVGAACVVSGDRFLLNVAMYEGIPVLDAATFLARFFPGQDEG